MNKTAKFIVGLTAVLLFSAVVTGFYLSRHLPSIVKQAIETYGPKTTGTPVKLDRVRFNFITGSVTLKNFVVSNPKGYTTNHAFQFDDLVFTLDLSTVFKKVIVIRRFNIDGASIIAEQRGSITHTNLKEISDHADIVNAADDKANNKKFGMQQKLIVSHLIFSNNTVDLVSETFGSRKIKLPDIILNDIGKKEGGLTPDQMTQRITRLVTIQVSNAVQEELKKMAVEKGKDTAISKVKSWLGK